MNKPKPTDIFEKLILSNKEIKNNLVIRDKRYYTRHDGVAGQSLYFYVEVSLGDCPTQKRAMQVRLSDHFSNEVMKNNILCIYSDDENVVEKIKKNIEKMKNAIFASNKEKQEKEEKLKRLQKIAFQIATPKKITKFLKENFPFYSSEIKNENNIKGLELFLSKNSF